MFDPIARAQQWHKFGKQVKRRYSGQPLADELVKLSQVMVEANRNLAAMNGHRQPSLITGHELFGGVG